jgi:hypothetical protein
MVHGVFGDVIEDGEVMKKERSAENRTPLIREVRS